MLNIKQTINTVEWGNSLLDSRYCLLLDLSDIFENWISKLNTLITIEIEDRTHKIKLLGIIHSIKMHLNEISRRSSLYLITVQA